MEDNGLRHPRNSPNPQIESLLPWGGRGRGGSRISGPALTSPDQLLMNPQNGTLFVKCQKKTVRRVRIMITRLRAGNFKSWEDTGDLRLGRLTGLFGTNSSGKTR